MPLSESEFFVNAYQEIGGYAELVVFDGANHGFFTNIESIYTQRAIAIIDDWLRSD